jgi:nucleotide-binding universal stress UspA family protein
VHLRPVLRLHRVRARVGVVTTRPAGPFKAPGSVRRIGLACARQKRLKSAATSWPGITSSCASGRSRWDVRRPPNHGVIPASAFHREAGKSPSTHLEEYMMYDKILVPLDGSHTAERGLREAIGLATGLKSNLLLLHIADYFPMMVEMASTANSRAMQEDFRQYGETVLEKASRAARDAGVQTETLFREMSQGRVAEVIVDEAQKAGCDLIVMGTHGRRGFSRMAMGSEAERVVRFSPVPVLLIRQEA